MVELRAGDAVADTLVRAQEPGAAGHSLAANNARTATIAVNYSGFAGSAEAREAFQRAVDEWELRISSPQVIRVQATFKPLAPGLLGAAGPAGFLADAPGLRRRTWYPLPLAEAVLDTNINGTQPDIFAEFNSTFDWDYEPNTDAPFTYDFSTVVLHELGHGLGFLGLGGVSGGIGSLGFEGSDGIRRVSQWDRVATLRRVAALNGTIYPDGSTALAAGLQSGLARFEGSLATRANGNVPPPLYSPNPFQPGSSYSHLSETAYPPGHAASLMTPFLDLQETVQTPGTLTLCMFEDLGWETSATCLPSAVRSLAIADRKVREGDRSRTILVPVTLGAPSTRSVNVTATTVGGTAKPRRDFKATTRTLVFAPGATTAALPIRIVGDTRPERRERFTVRLGAPFAASIADNAATITIRDDD